MSKNQIGGVISAYVGLLIVSAATFAGFSGTGKVAAASVFNVTTTADNVGSPPAGSLRKAFLDANATPGADIINITATGTINLAGALPNITEDVTINGPGANVLTVRRDTGGDYSVFEIDSFMTVFISGLTISNGIGGILNQGTLTISSSIITGNTSANGAGIGNSSNGFNGSGAPATLTVNNCTISGNSAVAGLFGGGGGIFNSAVGGSATVTVNNCTISGNFSNSDGGGIANHPDHLGTAVLTVNNSTISGNSANGGGGGGIANVTVFSDSGTAMLTVNNSTISGNSAGEGGGIANHAFFGGAPTATIGSSIIALNTAPTDPDVDGTFISNAFNLIGVSDGSTGFGSASDQVGTSGAPRDPMLETSGPGQPLLKDNGGPTPTIALLCGSPCIDRGNNLTSFTTDQRGSGFARTMDLTNVQNATGGDGTDIGAFELQHPCFDACIQDDSSGTVLQINTTTGDYQFSNCGGLIVGGTGSLLIKGSIITLQQYSSDRRILARIDGSVSRATATIQLLPQGLTFTITDRNTRDDTCACR
jgi:hypothetical protein